MPTIVGERFRLLLCLARLLREARTCDRFCLFEQFDLGGCAEIANLAE